jgi:hypothetical protein
MAKGRTIEVEVEGLERERRGEETMSEQNLKLPHGPRPSARRFPSTLLNHGHVVWSALEILAALNDVEIAATILHFFRRCLHRFSRHVPYASPWICGSLLGVDDPLPRQWVARTLYGQHLGKTQPQHLQHDG